MWYTILILLVVDVGGLLLIYALMRDRVRRATQASSQIAEIREEVSRLLVELNQTTDRNIALIEDRIAILNDQLGAADKKIGLLRRESEKHDVGTQVYSRLAEAKARTAAHVARPREARRDAAADLFVGSGQASEQSPSLAVELSQGPARPREGDRAPDMHERVMMLHRAGFSASLIASRVGAPLGEVELVISLEQRKGTA
jgi:type IV secretory pathway VirJ component